jgi:nicotinamide mononucleotide transporter
MLEWTAAALGVANLALLVWRSAWNYLFGMAMVALYFVIFWQNRLYGESGLQLFFFAAQGWGWWLWRRHGEGRVRVGWLDNRARIVWGMATLALSLNLGWALHRFTNAAMPFADSAVTGVSITAQILLSFRRCENWVLWIGVDIASIALYINRGLYPTAGLYGGFLVLSLLGLKEWADAARKSETVAA